MTIFFYLSIYLFYLFFLSFYLSSSSIFFFYLSIYIYKEECLSVCLFVRYAFLHRWTKCNETFQEGSPQPGEGRRLLFFRKKRTLQMLQAIYETDQ